MDYLEAMTPKQHVFLTLRNLIRMIDDGWDVESHREQLRDSLENAASWEPLLADISQPLPSSRTAHDALVGV